MSLGIRVIVMLEAEHAAIRDGPFKSMERAAVGSAVQDLEEVFRDELQVRAPSMQRACRRRLKNGHATFRDCSPMPKFGLPRGRPTRDMVEVGQPERSVG